MSPKSRERLVGSLVLLCIAVIFIPPFYDGRDPFTEFESRKLADMPHPPRFPEGNDMARQVASTGEGRLREIEKAVKQDIPESAQSDSQLPEKENKGLALDDFNAGEMTTQLLEDIAENSRIMSRFSSDKKIKQAWAVQVGSFSEAERATTLRDQLIAADFQAFIKTVVTDNQTHSRVFAGVSLDKSVAEDIQSELGSAFPDYESIIVPYQP